MSGPPLGWKPPKQVRFGKNANWITFGQDHCPGGLKGLPGDVWFDVDTVTSNGHVKLTAYGYGQLSKKFGPKPYGNGAIYVNWMDIAIWGRGRSAA